MCSVLQSGRDIDTKLNKESVLLRKSKSISMKVRTHPRYSLGEASAPNVPGGRLGVQM